MRKELNIFTDPKTGSALNLKIAEEKDGHVVSGWLYNKNKKYPIIRGIPRFVDKSFYSDILLYSNEIQTAKSFDRKWSAKRNQKLGATRKDIIGLKERLLTILGCNSESQLRNLFKGAKRVLNAGCGVAWEDYLFNYNTKTQRHCIDISLSVEIAYKKTKKYKNTVVSQASIFQLPYPNKFFDIIYSFGVIHHTPDPKKALHILIDKLVDGGVIGVYVYNKKPFLREIADTEIRKITTKLNYDECMKFAKKMTMLGMAFNKIKKPLIIKEDIEMLNIKKGEYNLHKFIYDNFLKCWFNPGQDLEYADLVNQDWYHPYFSSHHTKEELIGWFKEAGIKNPTCIQPKGWELSGYFISARKV